MHRVPLNLPTASVLWDRSLPETVLFERTLYTSNLEETMAFMHVLDDEAEFYKNQSYGIAVDMFTKAKSCILSSEPTAFGEGMLLINSIILRTPKDSPILASALKIRGHLLYYDCSFEYASNDYEMFLEVNRFKASPTDDTCEVMGNLIVCMYMKRQHGKAKEYFTLYQQLKAKLSQDDLQRQCFVQIESRIEKFMNELNDIRSSIPKTVLNTGYSITTDKDASFNSRNGCATKDIEKTEVIYVEYPLLISLNAPFVRCELCLRLSPQQIYTCLHCRYKTYCSLDCMQKDKPMHKDECLGFKQLALIILDAVGIYRIFRYVVHYLHDNVFHRKNFGEMKSAKEIWQHMLMVINEMTLKGDNCNLTFIKSVPQYERLVSCQYSTLVATAFRLAVFIDTKTDLIETCFKKLNISSKQKLILIGSLLMRIHCNILLNTYDFEIGTDNNNQILQADVERSTTLVNSSKSNCTSAIVDLNKHFNINVDRDVWQRSSRILESIKCNAQRETVKTSTLELHTRMCKPIHGLLSTYKDNIAVLFFNPELIQTVMYGPNAGQQIDESLTSPMCARLAEMTDVQRCLFLKRFARLFHHHYTEYFTRLSEVQVHQVLSLHLPKLSQYKHSCNPNVEIIVLDDGVVVGKSLRDIKKGEQLFISYKAHHARYVRTERQLFLEQFNINCQCIYCITDPLDNPANIRQGIYCESCDGVQITPEHGVCPKSHTQYHNLLTKYHTVISVFENKLSTKLKSDNPLTDREIYILQNIIYLHAKKYFVPHNEYRIKVALRYARYLAIKNYALQSYKLIMEIRDCVLQSYEEHSIWFTFYADILLAIKIILHWNAEEGLYTLPPKMLMQLCDLGLYIVRGQIDVIDFYEVFDRKCPYVTHDLRALLKWKDKIVCHKVLALANALQ